jgi:hypothetical protein
MIAAWIGELIGLKANKSDNTVIMLFRVEKSSFFLNSDIETLITNVESTVINELEAGNRQAGMKRLKVC